jgi:hypothetical protein
MNTITPYPDNNLNTIYNLLFCDDPGLYQSSFSGKEEYPWNVLFNTPADSVALAQLSRDTTVESRIQLLACRQLAASGQPVADKQLFGVIIEVGLEEGPDTLAAYKDGTARYINHSGKMIIWENPTAESNVIIQQLLDDSENVVAQIGPWTDPRLPAPGAGDIRLNFLVTDGLYFGQGPFEVLQGDAMGGPVIQSALALLQFLTAEQH